MKPFFYLLYFLFVYSSLAYGVESPCEEILEFVQHNGQHYFHGFGDDNNLKLSTDPNGIVHVVSTYHAIPDFSVDPKALRQEALQVLSAKNPEFPANTKFVFLARTPVVSSPPYFRILFSSRGEFFEMGFDPKTNSLDNKVIPYKPERMPGEKLQYIVTLADDGPWSDKTKTKILPLLTKAGLSVVQGRDNGYVIVVEGQQSSVEAIKKLLGRLAANVSVRGQTAQRYQRRLFYF